MYALHVIHESVHFLFTFTGSDLCMVFLAGFAGFALDWKDGNVSVDSVVMAVK